MPIDQPPDEDVNWGPEVRAVIAAVNSLEGVTAANLPETVRDIVAATVVGTGLITATPNDVADTVTISTTATVNATDAALRDRATHTGTAPASTVSDFAEAVDDRVASLLVAGANVSLAYNDAAGTLSIAAAGGSGGTSYTDEQVRDVIGSALVAGSNITITPNDGSDTITIAATGGGGGAYTDEQVRDVVAATLVAGANVTITPNDAGDTITITAAGSGTGGTSTAAYERGINMAGGEFSATPATLPGVYGTDYAYDTAAAFQAIADRGHTIIRLPFRWERIQPTRGGALNSAELGRIQQAVSDIAAAGMRTVLDVHNYARYINSTANGGATLVLGNTLPTADLVDLWTRLSTAFKSNAGVYGYGLMNEPHDLGAAAGTFTGITRYDWASGVQGWTGDLAASSNVSGKLRLSSTATAGNYNFRKDDAGAVTGGSTPTGNVLRFEATLVTTPGGTWTAKAQWQNSSFTYQSPTQVTYQRVDTGATVTGLITGVAVRVISTFSSIASPPTAFAIQIDGSGVSAGGVTVDIDNFAQGAVSGGQTGAQVWEAASQQVVTAIRNNSDTTRIMVPGYAFSGAQNWTTNHPAPWITGGGVISYEAHYYFDVDNSGDYPDSYGTENAAATAAGYTSLAARAVTQLSTFTGWLDAHDVDGFLGEFGWPNTADTTSWNAVGEAIYDLLDLRQVSGTYWAGGARWGTGYNLSAYTGTTQNTSKAQAAVIEAHPAAAGSSGSGFQAALDALGGRVTTLEAGGGGSSGGGSASRAASHLGPAFMVIGAATATDLATSKTNKSTHGLVEVIWDQVQSSAGGAVDATAVTATIDRILAAGLKVCLRVSPQYPPTFVQTGVPKFKRNGGNEYSPTQASGNNVRDWVFSATGREYVRDFLAKLFTQLDWTKIERVQLGGLVAGELAYPVNDGSAPHWWGYSAPAQTGTDLAPRMAVCPVPGHVPSSGTAWTDNDEIFVAWYQQSMINWMLWLIEQHRRWFSGPIWVLHPSSGMRKVSQTPTGAAALNYRLEASRGTDWDWQVGAYPDPDVHPYCTWGDAQHFYTPAPYSDVNDANAAPWYHLLRVARRAGRAARIWGENTVINSPNSVMNRVFKEGAVAFGYEGFTWLNHTSLALGSDDTYANWSARIAEVKVNGGSSAYPGTGGSGNAEEATGLDAEGVRDTVAAALVAGENVTIVADDATNTITVAAVGGTHPFYMDGLIVTGTAAVATGVLPAGARIGHSTTLREVRIRAGTAPVGGTGITVNCVRNGITLATVVVPAGSTSATVTVDVPLYSGDVLNFNVTTVGTTTAGSNVAATLSSVVTAFNPAQLSGIHAWFDISEQGGVNGAALTLLDDRYGSSDLTATDLKPIYLANGFGSSLPVLDATPTTAGATDWAGFYATDNMTPAQSALTIACVATAETVTQSGDMHLFGRELAAKVMLTDAAAPRLLVSSTGTSWAVNVTASGFTVTRDVPHVYTMVVGGGNAKLRVDGTERITSAFSGSIGSNASVFGYLAKNNNGSEPWRGLGGDLVVVRSALGTTDLVLLENYLRAQAGMVLV